MPKRKLFYGDNLEIMRRYIKDETVDLCYIDPPFNSKRDYNQIYNNIGEEDLAQAKAFVDTWSWDKLAINGYNEIISNDGGDFTTETVNLIMGYHSVLGEGPLLSYLVSMALRITEIQRVLKNDGQFILHCDPNASHYLKTICDAIFVAQGGDYRNEIIWSYESGGRSKQDFGRKHDILFRYSKSKKFHFDGKGLGITRADVRQNHMKRGVDKDGRAYSSIKSAGKIYKYYDDEPVIPSDVWTDISHLQQKDPERLGYPTQKPEKLMSRIIKSCSEDGDTILDAYCGCGTTIVVSEELGRNWIGIDITYQSIALMLKRLEDGFGLDIENDVELNGVPKDVRSAEALANMKDDRTRKEFEKWAALTFTGNRAIINDKKGADKGIDARISFLEDRKTNKHAVIQVKSGKVSRGDIAKLRGDMQREDAELGYFITLQPPTKPMLEEAKQAGLYTHPMMGVDYERIQIVTVEDILENSKRLQLPTGQSVLKKAKAKKKIKQSAFDI